MSPTARFPFVDQNPGQPGSGVLPYVPIVLISSAGRLVTLGLLDTGATVNVLPYQVGLQLGLAWDEATTPVHLTGNLGQAPARAVRLMAEIEGFDSVTLAFAWTRLDVVPVILGQVNFFMEFDVCFSRSHAVFDVSRRRVP
jgi:hypothetical protein